MALAGYFILRQREEILARALRERVARACSYAAAYPGTCYRAGRIEDAQRLIDHLSENPRVFSVILFDEMGRMAMFSNPLEAGKIVDSPDAQRVIATGEPVEIVRRRSGSEVYSFIMPIRISAARRGAFRFPSRPKSSNPITPARAAYCAHHIGAVRRDHRGCTVGDALQPAAPIKQLLGGAKAVGQGDLHIESSRHPAAMRSRSSRANSTAWRKDWPSSDAPPSGRRKRAGA